MTRTIDTSPVRLRELADHLDRYGTQCVFSDTYRALATEKEAKQCSDLCHPEEPCSISADGTCAMKKESQPEGKCPTCGSDCNERDELIKAEREIEKLREYANAVLASERSRVARLLAGIDKTEDVGDGWWLTSAGAEFGAGILSEVLSGQLNPATELLTDEEVDAVYGFRASIEKLRDARAIEIAVLEKNGLLK